MVPLSQADQKLPKTIETPQLKLILGHDVLVSGTILVYGIWNMVCVIWYENGIHSVFTYVSHASHNGCLQHSAYIPCVVVIPFCLPGKFIVTLVT